MSKKLSKITYEQRKIAQLTAQLEVQETLTKAAETAALEAMAAPPIPPAPPVAPAPPPTLHERLSALRAEGRHLERAQAILENAAQLLGAK